MVLVANIIISIFIYKLFDNLAYKFFLIITIVIILNPIILDYSLLYTGQTLLELGNLKHNLYVQYRIHAREVAEIRKKIHFYNTTAEALDERSTMVFSDDYFLARSLREVSYSYNTRYELALHNKEFFGHHANLLSIHVAKYMSSPHM